jgi:signal transduction histidine kinase
MVGSPKKSVDECTVTVMLRRPPEGLQLTVTDNGCGFDMKDHNRIFDLFQRLHPADQYPGTGIGLAIVSQAAERMGGRVWARSAPGKGAEFTFLLAL